MNERTIGLSDDGRDNKQQDLHAGLSPEKRDRAEYVIQQALAARASGGREHMLEVIGKLIDERWQGK